MLSVAALETAFAAAWPALETVEDGRWLARFGRGHTRRINSINCMDAADDGNAEERLAAAAALYEARSLAARFRVTPLTGRATFAALERGGWWLEESCLILTLALADTVGFDGSVTVMRPDDPEFVAAQARLQGYDAATAETFAAVVGRLDAPAAGLVLADADGAPAAALACVQAGGIGVFLNVVTAADRREQGLGRRLMASGLSWIAENGGAHAALQMSSVNAPALAHYLGMGFTYRYPYHYRRPGEGLAQ